MTDGYEAEAKAVIRQITPGPRLVVIGSTKFWGADSARICEAIAKDLAALEEIVAVTGGVAGVGQTFGQVHSAARKAMSKPENLYHLLPRGLGPCVSGITIGAGDDFFERREILGRLGQVYLMIEGGPGTQHEAEVAVSKGFPVIPVARTGGHAGEFYRTGGMLPGIQPEDWRTLAQSTASIQNVVGSVRNVVRLFLNV